MQTFFDDSDQDIGRHGNPYLRLHGVLTGTQKGFDTQMLFDPFEEQFDCKQPATPPSYSYTK